MAQTIILVPGKFKANEQGTPLADVSELYDDINNQNLSETLNEIKDKEEEFGPYQSVEVAHSALEAKGLNKVGTTVGIISPSNMVVEYWYQGGTAQVNLVLKQSEVEQVKSINNIPISGTGNIEVVQADFEDLANDKGTLKLADKAYVPNDFSGMGRVYLRKNMINASLHFADIISDLPSTETETLFGSCDEIVYETTNSRFLAVKNTSEGKKYYPNYQFIGSEAYSEPDNKHIYVCDANAKLYTYDNGALEETTTLMDKNVLMQDMINKPNTIYIIQYDYDIVDMVNDTTTNNLTIGGEYYSYKPITIEDNQTYRALNDCVFIDYHHNSLIGSVLVTGENESQDFAIAKKSSAASGVPVSYYKPEGTINIPANCVLQFEGGGIKSGTIVGNNTKIDARLNQIFSTNVTLSGTFDVPEAYPQWFGAIGDGVTDDTNSINKCFACFNVTELTNKTYKVGNLVVGSNKTIRNGKFVSGDNATRVIYGDGVTDITVYNIEVNGGHSTSVGIFFRDASRVTIDNCYVHNMYREDKEVFGIHFARTHHSVISNCKITDIDSKSNSTLGDSAGACRAIVIQECQSVTVSKNYISDILAKDDGDGIHLINEGNQTRRDIYITNNYIKNCSRRFIKVQANYVVIENNVFDLDSNFMPYDGWQYVDYGIQIYRSNTIIRNNEFLSFVSIPIHVGSQQIADIEDVDIINNKFMGGCSNNQGYILLYLVPVRNIKILNNYVEGYQNVSSFVIFRTDVERCVVANNIVKSCYTFAFFINVTKIKGIVINGNTAVCQNSFALLTTNIESTEAMTNLETGGVVITSNECTITDGNNQASAVFITAANPVKVPMRNLFNCHNNTCNLAVFNLRQVGYNAQKPDLNSDNIGFQYFARDLGSGGKGAMIYFTGDQTTPWVYADGTAIS